MAKKPPADPTEPTFEQSLDELEATVRRLEDGQLGLAEALSCYEGGVKRLKHCYELLRKAERRIELVRGVDEAGDARTQPLEDEVESLEEKADSRGRRRSKPVRRPSQGGTDKIDSPDRLF
jgi:exodeoxyribonuclease VII small subunit